MWSAGVILYIILCGYPPFYGETNKEILEQVKKGKLDFSGPEWKEKSPDILDLIKKMVCEADCRYTAQQVISHKWMLVGQNSAADITSQVLKKYYQGLQTFSNSSKLVQMTLIYLARQMNETEVMPIQAAFNLIEKSSLGQISPEEFIDSKPFPYLAGKSLGLDESSLKTTFDKLDFFEKRSLSYCQFSAGCISSDGYLNEDKIKSTFRIWDLDKDGVISLKDFSSFLGNEFPHYKDTKYFLALLQEVKAIASVGFSQQAGLT